MEKPTLNMLHSQALADEQIVLATLKATADNQPAIELAAEIEEVEALAAAWEAAETPDEQQRAKIEKLSAKLAHKIKDYAERELPEDGAEPATETNQQTEPATQQTAEATVAETNQQTEQVTQTPPAPAAPAEEDGELSYMERRRKRIEDEEA